MSVGGQAGSQKQYGSSSGQGGYTNNGTNQQTGQTTTNQTGTTDATTSGQQSGTTTGSQTGTNTGYQSGTTTGNQTGSSTGQQSGTTTGSQTGTTTGQTTGQTTGSQVGTQTGQTSGVTTTGVTTTPQWDAINSALGSLLGGTGLSGDQQNALNFTSGQLQNQPVNWGLQGVNDSIRSITSAPPPSVTTGSVVAPQASSLMGDYRGQYATDVLAPSLALFDENAAQDDNRARAARGAGSAFGDRAAIADSVRAGQNSLARGALAGNILGEGYKTALSGAQGDAALLYGASGQNAGNQLSASLADASNDLTARGQGLQGASQIAGNWNSIGANGRANADALYNMGGGGNQTLMQYMGVQTPAFGGTSANTGQTAAQTAGTNTGTTTGQQSGTTTGQTTGATTGQQSGTSAGQTTGTSTGQSGGTTTGQQTGTTTGQQSGTSSSATTLQSIVDSLLSGTTTGNGTNWLSGTNAGGGSSKGGGVSVPIF